MSLSTGVEGIFLHITDQQLFNCPVIAMEPAMFLLSVVSIQASVWQAAVGKFYVQRSLYVFPMHISTHKEFTRLSNSHFYVQRSSYVFPPHISTYKGVHMSFLTSFLRTFIWTKEFIRLSNAHFFVQRSS